MRIANSKGRSRWRHDTGHASNLSTLENVTAALPLRFHCIKARIGNSNNNNNIHGE
jgi:hypothetical protein